jgi:hypothetical protein
MHSNPLKKPLPPRRRLGVEPVATNRLALDEIVAE